MAFRNQQELRCPAADQQHGSIVPGLHILDRDVRLDQIARLFDVGIPVGREIVDDAVKQFALRGRDDGPVTRLAEPTYKRASISLFL